MTSMRSLAGTFLVSLLMTVSLVPTVNAASEEDVLEIVEGVTDTLPDEIVIEYGIPGGWSVPNTVTCPDELPCPQNSYRTRCPDRTWEDSDGRCVGYNYRCYDVYHYHRTNSSGGGYYHYHGRYCEQYR